MLDMLRQFGVSIASCNHIALFMKRFDLPTSSGSPPLPWRDTMADYLPRQDFWMNEQRTLFTCCLAASGILTASKII